MTDETFSIGGRRCTVFPSNDARYLLIQPADEHDLGLLGQEVSLISAAVDAPFILAAFLVEDWERDLSPWDAPPVFGKKHFGHSAPETLSFVERDLIPTVTETCGAARTIPVVLGGYSLAAFFSLWSVYQTSRFAAAAAASPSVWSPGWIDYAAQHTPKAAHIYLSLGDREEKTKDPVMSSVGDCIRRQYALLSGGEKPVSCVLEWNKGGHFRDPEIRCARAFSWCVDRLDGEEMRGDETGGGRRA